MRGAPPRVGKSIATLLSLLLVWSPVVTAYAASTDSSGAAKEQSSSGTTDSATSSLPPTSNKTTQQANSDVSQTSANQKTSAASSQTSEPSSAQTSSQLATAQTTTYNPPTISNPNVFGFQNSTPKVDGTSGALTESIPLDIPPGRNGMQPKLSLDYNSQNTAQDSEVGYGWSLSIPYIERLNKTGSQNMYGPSAYFTSSLDGELTIVTASTTGASVSVYLWGGGGGSGSASSLGAYGSGGGAGAYVVNSSVPVVSGTGYPIIIGQGGAGGGSGGSYGGAGYASGGAGIANIYYAGAGGGGGGSTSFNGTLIASGGGGGSAASGGGYGASASSGGNGGGGGIYQGGGGGGGSATAGSSASGALAGIGGTGGTMQTGTNGSGVPYGGGSSAGASGNGNSASGVTGGSGSGGASPGSAGVLGDSGGGGNGTLNTGGQAGGVPGAGAGGPEAGNYSGAAGGNGMVIIKAPIGIITATGGTHTQSGGYDIWTFTSSGTWTPTFGAPAFSAYFARIDDGSHRLYAYATSTNSWIMYDKSGTEYLFGASSQSQQSASTSPNQIYKWMLEKEIDPNGNYTRYVYNKDGNQIYPYQVIYTGHNAADGPAVVTFATSSRPDHIVSFQSGFEVDTNYRISQIGAAFNGSMVRQYNLGYAAGNNGSRSLLSSVQENGWDDNNVETVEPAMMFSYVNATSSFVTQNGACGPACVVADSNGDGINDVNVFYQTGGSNAANINGVGQSFSPPLVWAASSNGFVPYEDGVRYVDINGDGRPDLIEGVYNYSTGTYTNALYLNQYAPSAGYAWSSTTATGVVPPFEQFFNGSPPFATTEGILGDVNGDGLPDFEAGVYEGGGPDSQAGAYLGNGNGWNAATTTIFQPVTVMPGGYGYPNSDARLVDVNGDGLPDWEYTDGANIYFALNNGTGWGSPNAAYTIATSSLYYAGTSGYNYFYYDRGIRFVDVNGDGLPDYVHSYSGSCTSCGSNPPEQASYSTVMLNTGHGWATTTTYTLGTVVSLSTNGLGQLAGFNYSELENTNGNGQQDQDVLSTVTYPKGGSTSVTYGYTTQSGTNQQLPYSLLVVTKTVNHDGRGSNEETDYSYSGGRQYLPAYVFDRKFAGFAVATTTTSQATIVTYYSQGATTSAVVAGDQSDGYGQINHPFRTDVFTPGGVSVEKTFFQWNPIWHGNSEFVGLSRQLEQDYAGNGSHQDKDTDYKYSTSTDDLIEQDDYGAVVGNSDGTFTDIAGDSRVTKISYIASSSVNLSVPIEKTLFNNGGATTTDVKYLYDNLAFGQVSIGNQTQEQDLISTSTLAYASSTKTYNSYGLVTQSKDRNGNATAYSYDSLNLYPATITNAFSQSTEYTYNYSNGKVATTTNPNGGITKNSYDGIGRLTEIDQSNPTSPATLLTNKAYQYTDSPVPAFVHETSYLNSATSTYTYDYYDGLDRLIQERKSTENSGTSSVVDIIYNTVGKIASQSLPYFSPGTANTAATATVALFTNYTYDPLGRTLTTANAVGTAVNAYSGWVTTTTDPNGDIKDYIQDAFGNLAQVVEHGAASNATTTYMYDAANNLANITDALGNVRTFTYDGLGDRLSAQDLHAPGDGTFGSWSYSYDPQGNEISRTDPKGQVITHAYDALNRMLTESWTGQGVQVTNTYDSCINGLGLLCSASSTGAVDAYQYDVLGHTAGATTTIGGVPYGLAYSYDRLGNVTSVTNAKNASQLNYAYNSAGLISNVSRIVGGVTTNVAKLFNFTPTNQVGQIVFGSGASTTYSYDAAHLYRLSNILTLGAAITTYSTSTASALVVGGGGGGGGSSSGSSRGGGGGAGGYQATSSISFAVGTYTITVGSGGAGGTTSGTSPGSSGATSSIGALLASNGGGGGGTTVTGVSNTAGTSGGSGGGTGGDNCHSAGGLYGSGNQPPTTPSQGNNGGLGPNTCVQESGSGGGGSSAAGSNDIGNGSSPGTGVGGAGTSNSITGSATIYAAGGNAGGAANPGTAGAANTGNGGNGNKSASAGGAGGSGIVVISYPTAAASKYTCGGTTTVSGANTICTYASSGTFTVSNSGSGSVSSVLQNMSYAYDADGNIISRTDGGLMGQGQQVTYTYDNLNRLLSASTSISAVNSYIQNFTYDALGNILSGPYGSYSYQGNTGSSYANPDAVTQTVLTTGGSAPTIAYDNSAISGNGTPASSLTFSYTTNNNTNGLIVVGVEESAPTGSCTPDKITGVTYNGTALTDAGYYAGNATSVGGALKTYYGFAPATSTHNIVVSASASCILYATAATYTGVKQSSFPDASGTGNPLSDSGAVLRMQATTTTTNNNAWAVLSGVSSGAGAATAGPSALIRQQQTGNLVYSDSNGPISPAGQIGLNWTTASSTHWAADYFSLTPVTSYPGTVATSTYGYDADGNLTSVVTGATSTTYAYDYLSRLIGSRTTGASATTTYTFDPFGTRISQSTASTTTIYPNKYYSIVSILAGSTTAATSTDYVFSGDTLLSTIDQKMVNGTATGTPITRYIHPDNLGSTNVTSDASGTLAQWFDYAPYGSVIASSNTGSSNLGRQYIGQMYDQGSQLSYLNARYYSGSQGQFLSQDPIFTGDPRQQNLPDPQSLNAYSYSDDNPITKSDPGGKCGWICAPLYVLFSPDVAGDPVFNADGTVSPTPQQSSISTSVFVGGFMTGGSETKVAVSASEATFEAGLQAARADAMRGIYKPLSEYVGEVSANSYSALKTVIGSAKDTIGEGYQWHHIVEQNSANVSKFGNEVIQNTRNIVALPSNIHQEVSSIYSSANGLGQTFRQSISTQSLLQQLSAGLQVLSGILNKLK